ncbi:hypothetical protein B0H34DRAFT_174804 [Crassisporium funariophilum]|nr:hypothetical protein B0H34DRAFT_174804 [Crassisporium funariophilum]
MDRSASKGYSPSITPSSKSAAFRSSDGDRTGSDSDRRLRADKGKEKQRDEERDRDRDRGLPSATASPVNKRSSAFGASSIARNSSSHGGGADMLSSTWNGGAAPPISSSRSPSTKTAHSRSPSVYTNNNNNNMHGGEGDYNSMHEYSGAPHGSAVDEHANDYQWDHQAPPQSAALDAILDRPRSPYVDPSRSPYGQAQGENGFDRPASAYDQYGGNNDRPRSPFVNDPQHAYDSAGGIGRSSSPFVDRPKSGVGMEGSSFFDRPKSAFGDAHQGSMFGDTGPAADAGDAGHGEPLFGDPPASVFGDTAAAGGGPAYDSWSMPQEQTPVAEAPAVTPTASKKKGKKGSTATTPVASTPASGLASKASPAFGANKSPSKSPFGQTQDTGFYDDPPPAVSPVVAHAAVSPAISGGGSMWGSKAPSPYDKKDKLPSPLNPISHVHDDPPPPAANDFDWGFDSKGAGAGTGAAGGGSGDFGWNNNADSNDFYAQDQPPAASPIPTPVEEPVVEKGVKGKKKKVTAVNAAKQAQEDEEKAKKERKKEQDEREEKERLEREEANRKAEEDRLMAEEDERLQKEIKELEEKERLEKEQKERLEKEERERKEEEDRVKSAAAAPTSLFGSSEPAGLFSGGGDDSWGSGFGAPTAFGKKKKGKATTPLSASQPSAFGVSSWSFGGAGDDTTTQAAVSSTDPPATDLAPISGGGGGIFDFASSGPNLSFGFGGSSSAFGVSSPVPVLDATTPAVDAPPEVGGNEAADGIASAEAEESKDQEEDFSASKNPKKKKKKGGAAGLEATKEETPKEETSKEDTPQEVIPDAAEPVAAEPETPVVETPTVVETTGGGKKKKKGKK